MPLNFPSSPSTSTTYTFNNRTWTYNGNAWALSSGGSLNTSVVPEGNGLYFTNARATAAVTNSTLSNLTLSGNVTAGNVTLATNGVIRFPDGTTQNTATSASGTLLNIITRSGNVAVGTQNRTISIQGRSSNTTVAIA